MIRVNITGWLGYFLFAGLGTTLFIYAFLPFNNCYVTPLFCVSMYGLYHVPLGVTGFFIFSHIVGHRNVRIYLLILLTLGLGVLTQVPHTVHAQPVAIFNNPQDYYPFTYWVDKPTNVSYATTILGDEFYVFEWAFFWPYHPTSVPSTCSAAIPTYDWELVYVYVSFTTQQTVGVAYRFHCQWTFIDPTYPGGVVAVALPTVLSINATRPVITFISRYHIPVNDYPGGPRYVTDVRTSLVEFQGTFTYIQQDYNYTNVAQLNPDSRPIAPDFFRNTNWYNVEVFTIGGFVVWGAFGFIFLLERRKLAGPVTR